MIQGNIKGQGEQSILLNKLDAETRDIKDGSVIKVFNDRGSFKGVAKISEDVNAGIVVATSGLLAPTK